ncbi:MULTISPECIES: hypothetical protein [unclassified Streptomyces]|uniref:hypothetical protein n=1 Tax=unclassified Streptomyces TaxID=2593676 RepID=UPI0035DF36F8
MNDIATRDMTPEQTFTAATTGPVLADVTCPDGTVTVTVDPAATVANVRVFTQDGPDSPAADAARGARIQQNAERLIVVVPKVKQNGANFGNNIFQSFGGGATYINGVRYSGNVTVVNGQVIGGGGAQNFTRGVEVHVTLPAGSGVQYSGENGSLHTCGTVAAIRAESSNGSIKAETVGRIEAEAGNGSIKVGTVTEWIDAEASNGSVKVDNHIGSAARVRAGNGSVNFTVGAKATGRIDIKAGNGTVKLYGVRGRDDLDVRATAGNGTVKKF